MTVCKRLNGLRKKVSDEIGRLDMLCEGAGDSRWSDLNERIKLLMEVRRWIDEYLAEK